jgi:hypothetical protein
MIRGLTGWRHQLDEVSSIGLNPPLASLQCAKRPQSPFAKGERRHYANRTHTEGGFCFKRKDQNAIKLAFTQYSYPAAIKFNQRRKTSIIVLPGIDHL